MAADLFDFAAERLEHHTSFNQLEARGTLRIALKVAGLDAGCVTAGQLCVIFEKVMPTELEKRGVSDARGVCAAVLADLANAPTRADEAPSTDLDEVFGRLGGD